MQTYNIEDTYIYEDELCLVILADTVFAIISTTNRFKIIPQLGDQRSLVGSSQAYMLTRLSVMLSIAHFWQNICATR